MNIDKLNNIKPRTSIGILCVKLVAEALVDLDDLPNRERLRAINAIRLLMHEQYSPFHREPVDCVLWVESDLVAANDYNPNVVAPPEMKLLEHSIAEDGYTQPVVTWIDDNGELIREVIDGFHRRRVGVESESVKARCHGYLPVTTVNTDRTERSDRIASTIRHNRARGKHQVTAMSDIVIELKRRNWSDNRVAKELGMDADEVLRLCQITGLSEVFSDVDFSKAWDIELLDDNDIELDDLLMEEEE